ncbi:YciC family protein [Orbus sturtevantii]|uniref:YciC family protein n=1 Tax=Orbus sturtevantii TaxID=3074109 RepID=UPI00370D3C81
MLSFSSLLSDTKNFISNNLVSVTLTVLSLAIITQLVDFFFYPSIDDFLPIKQLIELTIQKYGNQSPEALSQTILALPQQEQQSIIPAAMSYLARVGIIFLAINLLSMSMILALIYTISSQQLSLANMLKNISRMASNIILFMLITIPGFIGLSLIVSIIPPLAIPLIIIAISFYIMIYFAFLTVIIDPVPQYGFSKKLKIALAFLRRKVKLIVPIVAIWFFTTFLLDSFASMLISNLIALIVFYALKLLLSIMALCYLYRLYSLSNKELAYDTSN